MRWFFLAVSLLVAVSLPCDGAVALMKAGPGVMGHGLNVRSGPAAPALPGDTVAFTAWWGLRAYSSAQLTGSTNAVRVRRSSDNFEYDIKVLPSGLLDVGPGSGPLDHCTSTSCFVSIFYDQTGNNACGGASCNCVQTTAAAQLSFVFNCLGTKPCVQSSAAAVQCISANNFTPATGTQSLHYVGGRTTGTVATVPISVGSLSRITPVGGAANWQLLSNGGSITRAATDGAWHVAAGVAAAGANLSSLSIDGVTTVGTVTPGVTVAAPLMARGGAGATQSTVEGGFIDNAVLSAGQIGALNASARAYYGIP